MSDSQAEKRPVQWQEVLLIVAFLVVWFVLNRWVLPRFGVGT